MLYIDSANVSDIVSAMGMGVVGGVTTNPILANKADVSYSLAHIREILMHSHGPVHVQPRTLDDWEMWAGLDKDRIVLKIPMSVENLVMVGVLENHGVRTNVTAVMSVEQAILAAEAGASYVSLFWGRISDTMYDGAAHAIVRTARKCLYKSGCRIIVGSIREPEQVTEALEAGAHIVTASLAVLKDMAAHATTTKTIGDFDAAWELQCKR